MTCAPVIKVLAIAGFLSAGAGSPAVAQGRDPLRPRMARPVIAVVRAPTIIAIGDTTQAERPFSAIRATVDNLGFTLQVFATPIRQVVDQPHHAVYYVPPDLATGFVIITPGRRPVTVYGLISPDSLRARVLEYSRLTRPLERDRS
jgi:hypothetical protein